MGGQVIKACHTELQPEGWYSVSPWPNLETLSEKLLEQTKFFKSSFENDFLNLLSKNMFSKAPDEALPKSFLLMDKFSAIIFRNYYFQNWMELKPGRSIVLIVFFLSPARSRFIPSSGNRISLAIPWILLNLIKARLNVEGVISFYPTTNTRLIVSIFCYFRRYYLSWIHDKTPFLTDNDHKRSQPLERRYSNNYHQVL